ncbi:hypothetical protein GCM10010910_22850 [Microbacterium nanhaiense]|uniref:Secreted protein n=1 Tax=Microbacterium nanhaiense TaxID=1301026 RepID=A0ABQ2N1Y0_9MICO|nr:hypothetical protein GCM10010910_22850 [Microbacterium nanhaiense]
MITVPGVPAVARVFAVTIVARVVIVGHGRGRPAVVLAVVVRRGVILLVHHVPPSLRLPTELDGATRRSFAPRRERGSRFLDRSPVALIPIHAASIPPGGIHRAVIDQ